MEQLQKDLEKLTNNHSDDDELQRLRAEVEDLKALENAVNEENAKVIAEMKTEYNSELEGLKQSAYEVQLAFDSRGRECEEAKSQLNQVEISFSPSNQILIHSFTHLNRNQIESNLTVPGIQGCHTIVKSSEMSPHLICQG